MPDIYTDSKIIIVEPIGLTQGAEPMYASYLSNALADAGAYVTVVTFDGLLARLDSKVKHVSYCEKLPGGQVVSPVPLGNF